MCENTEIVLDNVIDNTLVFNSLNNAEMFPCLITSYISLGERPGYPDTYRRN